MTVVTEESKHGALRVWALSYCTGHRPLMLAQPHAKPDEVRATQRQRSVLQKEMTESNDGETRRGFTGVCWEHGVALIRHE